MRLTGDNTIKRLALPRTGQKNKYGRDHQHQRTDDQQQYLGSAPPFGGLRRRLIRLIVTHIRSAIETHGYHELVGRYRQGHQHEVTLHGISVSELATELGPLRASVRGALREMRMLLRQPLRRRCVGSAHRLLGRLRGDLLLGLTEGRNSPV